MVLTEVMIVCALLVAFPKVILAKPTSVEVHDDKEVHLHHHYHHHHHHKKTDNPEETPTQIIGIIPIIQEVALKEPTKVFVVDKKKLVQEVREGFLNTPKPPVKPLRFYVTKGTTTAKPSKKGKITAYVTPIPVVDDDESEYDFVQNHETTEEDQENEAIHESSHNEYPEGDYEINDNEEDTEDYLPEEVLYEEQLNSEETPKSEVYYKLHVDDGDKNGHEYDIDDDGVFHKKEKAYVVNYKIYPDGKKHKKNKHSSKKTIAKSKDRSYSESYIKIWV